MSLYRMDWLLFYQILYSVKQIFCQNEHHGLLSHYNQLSLNLHGVL